MRVDGRTWRLCMDKGGGWLNDRCYALVDGIYGGRTRFSDVCRGLRFVRRCRA